MLSKQVVVVIMGLSFGLLASAGVFSALITVGLTPRFAGKTGTARYVFLYEECIMLGTLFGSFLSVFDYAYGFGQYIYSLGIVGFLIGRILVILYGVFAGIFVGCLALAIAEMLGSIPIFARRIGMRHGLGICVSAVATGKVLGSLLYFFLRIFEIAP